MRRERICTQPPNFFVPSDDRIQFSCRAIAVRSRPYFSRDWYVPSGFCDDTRWVPRMETSALRMASLVMQIDPTVLIQNFRSRPIEYVQWKCSHPACLGRSVLRLQEHRRMTVIRQPPPAPGPETLVSISRSFLISAIIPVVLPEIRATNAGTTPSDCSSKANSKWDGSIIW